MGSWLVYNVPSPMENFNISQNVMGCVVPRPNVVIARSSEHISASISVCLFPHTAIRLRSSHFRWLCILILPMRSYPETLVKTLKKH